MNVYDTDDRAQLIATIERCYEDAAQRRVAHIHEPRPTLGDIADAILAAGFGNAAHETSSAELIARARQQVAHIHDKSNRERLIEKEYRA